MLVQAIASSTFDDPAGVVEILARLRPRRTSALSVNTYKLDEVATWNSWSEPLNIKMHGLHDLHYIRFCRREDIGHLAQGAPCDDFPPEVQRAAGDIFVVTKGRLHDAAVLQVTAIIPANRGCAVGQPVGVANRRPISEDVRKSIQAIGPKCLQAGFISNDAMHYLKHWSEKTLVKARRPDTYEFLGHRWRMPRVVLPAAVPFEDRPAAPMRVVLLRNPEGHLPVPPPHVDAEGEADAPVPMDM